MAFESQENFKNFDRANIISNLDSVSSVFSSAVLTSQQKVRGLDPLLQQLVNRQKKGRKQEATDQQKTLDLIAKITDPSYNRAEAARKNEARKKKQIDHENETQDLLMEMDKAHDEDHKILALARSGNPKDAPMNRFNLLSKVQLLLAKKAH